MLLSYCSLTLLKKYVTIDYKAPAFVSEEQKAEEQVVLDEIAAFEAELAAELGQ